MAGRRRRRTQRGRDCGNRFDVDPHVDCIAHIIYWFDVDDYSLPDCDAHTQREFRFDFE